MKILILMSKLIQFQDDNTSIFISELNQSPQQTVYLTEVIKLLAQETFRTMVTVVIDTNLLSSGT